MDWKAQLDKATAAIKSVADSDKVKNLTAKAKETASDVARMAKQGAHSAADAVAKATSDPATLRLSYMGAEVSVVSPSDGLQITRPHAAAVVISDGAGNGLVINLTPPKAQVGESVGVVKKLNETTFDLGPEDGANVVILKA
jgi:hypothetical protein